MKVRAAVVAAVATLAGAVVMSGALTACGQKGPLYLPQQKKSRVPATPSNPAPDTPETPDTPASDAPSGEIPSNDTPSNDTPPVTSPHA